jgi:MarR family transcriptional regulator, organic hydroperoxide resistance regulator
MALRKWFYSGLEFDRSILRMGRGRQALAEQNSRKRPLTAAAVRTGAFVLPVTVSHPALLEQDGDAAFRQVLYLMLTAFGRLQTCRDAFGRSVGLTGSQFAVLIGTAHTQGGTGVSIGQLADHVQLAATHVTTEVGRLVRRGLLQKRLNPSDRRSVLVRLSARGEQRLLELSPFVRSVNDLLFDGIDRAQFLQVGTFLTRFVRNTEAAVAEIRRREQAGAKPRPRPARQTEA